MGKKLAELFGETAVKARHATARLELDQRAKFNHDYAELLEKELAPSMRSLFAHVLEMPDLPDPMREYFQTLMHPEHQANIWLILAAVLGIGLSGPGAAATGLLQRLQVESLKKWGDVFLSPQESAAAVVKGHLDRGVGGEWALFAGMHDDRFQVLVDSTGNPPGPETLLTMLNRGKIDPQTFIKGIRQGLIRDEWIDAISALRYAPISVPEAIAAQVEGHLTADEVAALMRENGIDERYADTLYETAGEPPGPQEMLALWNRGEIDQATVEQAIRESRVKNKYIPAVLKLARRLMPERTVVSGITKGVLTHDQGIERLRMLGFNAEDAAALAGEASSTKMAKHKEIAESQVLTAYEDGMIQAAEAQSMIEKLGYDAAEATFALQLADHRKEEKFRSAGVARVHTLFVSHHIDNSKASNALDALGVHPDMRNNLLKLWDLERTANVPRLTVAQWQGLYKRGAITDAEFVQEMTNYGYTSRDAAYLLFLTGPSPKGGANPPGPPGF